MKTETAIKKAGSKLALARLLSITRQSIQKWTEEVPRKQEERLRALAPQWFKGRSVR